MKFCEGLDFAYTLRAKKEEESVLRNAGQVNGVQVLCLVETLVKCFLELI